MLKTRLTELLGIEYPIQCGTMQGLTRAEVVAAVANAGGFSCIPAAMFAKKEDLLDEIKKAFDLTDKPFGVNVGLFPEMVVTVTAEERISWVIEAGVKILETAGRSPQPYRQIIADGGLIHIHKCARVRDAKKVDGLGVDIVSIVGTECGGHPSMEDVTSLILIPQARDVVNKPLIAGGGICDGRSLVAALALGADGVNIGTRFMATKEFPIHEDFKQRLVDSPETGSVLVMKSIMNPMRALRTPWTEKVLEMESKGATLEELAPMITGDLSRTGWQEGNIDEGMYPAGQSMGRIKDIPSIPDLIKRIVDEAQEAKERVGKLFYTG